MSDYTNEYKEIVKDIERILDEDNLHTWDDFNLVYQKEREAGAFNKAILLALKLITPALYKEAVSYNLKDEFGDLFNNMFLKIATKIENYDPSQAAFFTFINPDIKAEAINLARKGISPYAINKKGYSEESLTQINDEGKEVVIDLIDETKDTEMEAIESGEIDVDIIPKLGIHLNNQEDLKKTFGFLHLFMGGYQDLSNQEKEQFIELLDGIYSGKIKQEDLIIE